MKISAKVSVILPTYNRGHLIQRAINSALKQTYSDLEIIVINDCSTDDTKEKIKIINDSRIIYLENSQNMGPSYSRNLGISIAKGKYIAFIDSDDFWYQEKIEKQFYAMENAGSEFGASYCGMEYFDYSSGEKIGESQFEQDFKLNFTKGKYLQAPANVTMFIRKDILDKIGAYDLNLKAHEHTQLTIRISKEYKFININEKLVGVIRNHSQLMGNNLNYIHAMEILIEKHKNYLSKSILFSLCKQIANYYIITDNFINAKIYVLKALSINYFNAKTILQLLLIQLFPQTLKKSYTKKYSGKIPLSSGL